MDDDRRLKRWSSIIDYRLRQAYSKKRNINLITLDFRWIKLNEPELAQIYLENPRKELELLKKAFTLLKNKEGKVLMNNVMDPLSSSDLQTYKYDKHVVLKGIVTNKKKLTESFLFCYACSSCGEMVKSYQRGIIVVDPRICNSCGGIMEVCNSIPSGALIFYLDKIPVIFFGDSNLAYFNRCIQEGKTVTIEGLWSLVWNGKTYGGMLEGFWLNNKR